MTTLNLLKVCFNTPIQHSELRAFKASFFQELRTQTHLSEPYPLLQFKTRFQDGYLQPMLVVLGQKIGLLQELLRSGPLRIYFRNREEELEVSHLRTLNFELRTDQGFHTYNLFKYHAFNQDNYRQFQNLDSPEEQNLFLQKILCGHLDTFVKGVGWLPDPPIIVKNISIKKERVWQGLEYKPHCFDLSFRTNLWIPEHVGLGKRISLGMGTLRLPKPRNGRVRKG